MHIPRKNDENKLVLFANNKIVGNKNTVMQNSKRNV